MYILRLTSNRCKNWEKEILNITFFCNHNIATWLMKKIIFKSVKSTLIWLYFFIHKSLKKITGKSCVKFNYKKVLKNSNPDGKLISKFSYSANFIKIVRVAKWPNRLRHYVVNRRWAEKIEMWEIIMQFFLSITLLVIYSTMIALVKTFSMSKSHVKECCWNSTIAV